MLGDALGVVGRGAELHHDDTNERLERAGRFEARAEERRAAPEHRDRERLRGRVGARAQHHTLEELERRGAVTARGSGGVVMRVGGEHLGDAIEAAALLAAVEPEARDARAEELRLVAVDLAEARAEQADELGALALALVEALERRVDARVGRPERGELLEVADGARRIAGEVARDLRRLLEHVRARGLVVRGDDARVVKIEEVVPARGGGQRELEPLERPRCVDLEQAAEQAQRAIVVVELLEEVRRAAPDRARERRVDRRGEGVLVGVGDDVGSIDHAREALGAVPQRDLRRRASRRRVRGEPERDLGPRLVSIEEIDPPREPVGARRARLRAGHAREERDGVGAGSHGGVRSALHEGGRRARGTPRRATARPSTDSGARSPGFCVRIRSSTSIASSARPSRSSSTSAATTSSAVASAPTLRSRSARSVVRVPSSPPVCGKRSAIASAPSISSAGSARTCFASEVTGGFALPDRCSACFIMRSYTRTFSSRDEGVASRTRW